MSDRAIGRQRFPIHASITKTGALRSLCFTNSLFNQGGGHLYGFRLVLTGSAYSALAMRWTVPLPTPNCFAILCRPGRPGAAKATRMRSSNLVSMNGLPQCVPSALARAMPAFHPLVDH
jgi:hypothetical protein